MHGALNITFLLKRSNYLMQRMRFFKLHLNILSTFTTC